MWLCVSSFRTCRVNVVVIIYKHVISGNTDFFSIHFVCNDLCNNERVLLNAGLFAVSFHYERAWEWEYFQYPVPHRPTRRL